MTQAQRGKRVAILATEGFEQVELTGPREALEKAGAHWVDQEVVVDGQLISSRKPDDIPAFSQALVEQLARAG
ncbi:protease I [Halopseudomonas formosensis]|uniref:Protease I n=1 Tax=Halopseudomonas formosensis TaxID=1002526 RepID=A0A1I6BT02_9GAMM|nr:DJ-1/PfpI family protein [Halopseudomonas formosensis]SFQ84068.1 protease I [Halopseudomonas formosensis]